MRSMEPAVRQRLKREMGEIYDCPLNCRCKNPLWDCTRQPKPSFYDDYEFEDFELEFLDGLNG